ncbi:MAG: hypothetical protein K0R52_436 [Alphaproteobacteria bacterium]|jgi:hypothetical protein|nr:hypothetical protein [Alphaproteobacteria bacterium]
MVENQTSMGLLTTDRTRSNMGLFKDYSKLFNLICELVPDVKFHTEWRFISHSADAVALCYQNMEWDGIAINPVLKEAYEQKLSLLEICTGDCMDTQYIAPTSSAHMYHLMKQWCIAYCEFHNLDFTVTGEGEKDALTRIWEGK